MAKWLIRLYKGHATAIKKKSDNSLYSEEFATFGEDEVYDHSHAGRIYPSLLAVLSYPGIKQQ